MEHFKIENFEREKTGNSFPSFQTLEQVETLSVLNDLFREANLDHSLERRTLELQLYDMSQPIENVNAEVEGFDLSALAARLGLTPQQQIYIDWHRGPIDRMGLSDLLRYLDYIWYPGPDDIALFDDTLSWVLFATHYGVVRLLQFKGVKVVASIETQRVG